MTQLKGVKMLFLIVLLGQFLNREGVKMLFLLVFLGQFSKREGVEMLINSVVGTIFGK